MANPAVPSRPPLALIINDQEWWARSLESILAAKGYAVLRAYNGAQALLTARNARPDVIFVELELPNMDGVVGTTPGLSVLVYGEQGAIDVRHQRAVLFLNGRWVLLVDYLDGEGSYSIESRFASADRVPPSVKLVLLRSSLAKHA